MDLYFSALDELIQIVYQGSAKFVLISGVDYTSWTVHLGLSGPEGRWWRGKWTDEDVKAITVSPRRPPLMITLFNRLPHAGTKTNRGHARNVWPAPRKHDRGHRPEGWELEPRKGDKN